MTHYTTIGIWKDYNENIYYGQLIDLICPETEKQQGTTVVTWQWDGYWKLHTYDVAAHDIDPYILNGDDLPKEPTFYSTFREKPGEQY